MNNVQLCPSSLLTLALQNAALSIVMHYSRVSIHPDLAYSPATAVLLNELLKGAISFIIAFFHSPILSQSYYPLGLTSPRRRPAYSSLPFIWLSAFFHLCSEVFSTDAWKLSIPALLYVVQNTLQFVAISNLPVASFQVTYQMKILTTAAFSVALLRKKLSAIKWLSLLFLAMGVGIVQLQTAVLATTRHKTMVPVSAAGGSSVVGSAQEFHVHVMSPLKGFGAVTAACFTSGLAGVYFEMVLKGSKSDLWVRNVQLSLFSLIPALLPILYASPPVSSHGFLRDLFRHFGPWAWATVSIQVFGGLVTAIVIKYSDNILKGFATSLSIVLSFLASVVLFDFRITPSFVIGAGTVLGATWMYNSPSSPPPSSSSMPSTPLPEKLPFSAVDQTWGDYKRPEKDFKFSLVVDSPTVVSNHVDGMPSSGKSSPSRSYPNTPILLGAPPIPSSIHNHNQNTSVLTSLGVNSFMRRKPTTGVATTPSSPSPFSSRTSSTGSLSGLLGSVSERISISTRSVTSLASSRSGSVSASTTPPCGLGTGSGLQLELGRAENGEVVHSEGGLHIPGESAESLEVVKMRD